MTKKQYRAMIFLSSGQMVRSGAMELSEQEHKAMLEAIRKSFLTQDVVITIGDVTAWSADVSAIHLAEED